MDVGWSGWTMLPRLRSPAPSSTASHPITATRIPTSIAPRTPSRRVLRMPLRAHEKVRRFLNASSTREIVFVRGTTEGINLVAQAWGRRYVEKGDQVVITWLEHHSNIVPWQQLCVDKGARLRVRP